MKRMTRRTMKPGSNIHIIPNLQTFKHFIFLVLFSFVLAGCTSSGSDDGTITGTGSQAFGTAAEGQALANSAIELKFLDGEVLASNTDSNGKFAVDIEKRTDAFIARADRGDNRYYYSIGYPDGELDINVNIHPLTDLIVRNWFAQQNMSLDELFSHDLAVENLPGKEEIELIAAEVNSIIALAVAQYNVNDFDLFTSAFDANGQGFDGFLDFSSVLLDNQTITLSITDSESNIQSNIIENVALTADFSSDNDTPPSMPSNVRAVANGNRADNINEIIVVWQPSIDDKGIAGYRVYRNAQLIDTVPYPVYIDTDVVIDERYTYQIEAVDGREQVSSRSQLSDAVLLDAPDTIPPTNATNLSVSETDPGVLTLLWQQTEIGDVFGFKIVRNGDEDFAFVTGTSFVDRDILANTIYCYEIITVDAAGNESPVTAPVCLEPGENNAPSSVSFATAELSVFESAGVATIHIARLGDTSDAISVNYRTTALSATREQDFAATSGTLEWLAGDNRALSFAVPILADDLQEENETLLLELSTPVDTLLGSISQATLTIINNDTNCTELQNTLITTDTTLSESCYYINTDILVSNGATLSITPGVTLFFGSGMTLSVLADGAIQAVGSSDQPILFTGLESTPGYWNGLDIRSDRESTLNHTVVEFAGKQTSDTPANIALSGLGRLHLENTMIRYSEQYGFIKSAETTLTHFANNHIRFNQGAPVNIDIDAVALLDSQSDYTGNMDAQESHQDFIYITGAQMTVPQTWSRLNVPYRLIEREIQMREDLSIAPGSIIELSEDAEFEVRHPGALKAIGTEDLPIIFTGVEKTPGYWDGLHVLYNGNPTEISHAIIEYGGGDGSSNTQAALSLFGVGSELALSHSTIRFSEGIGIEVREKAALDMNNVTITDNHRPAAFRMGDLHLLDSNSRYTGNTQDSIIVSMASRFPTVDDPVHIPKIDVPYALIWNRQLVDINAPITIEPGVNLQFGWIGGWNVTSTGSITAEGTQEEPITFSGKDPNKGHWDGIHFSSSNSAENRFNNVIFSHAGNVEGISRAVLSFTGTAEAPSQGQVTNTVFNGSPTNAIRVSPSSTGEFSRGNTFDDIDGENILISD